MNTVNSSPDTQQKTCEQGLFTSFNQNDDGIKSSSFFAFWTGCFWFKETKKKHMKTNKTYEKNININTEIERGSPST